MSNAKTLDNVDVLAQQLIEDLGYTALPVEAFPDTPIGWEEYCAQTGLKYFSGKELAHCHLPALMRHVLGRDWDLPAHKWWRRQVAVACASDRLRGWLGQPVYQNWGYRRSELGADVNAAAKGEQDSDHIHALAMDLRFTTIGIAREAEAWLVRLRKEFPYAHVSLGFGSEVIHVGLFRPHVSGKDRTWVYASRKATAEQVLAEAAKRAHIQPIRK